MKDKTLGIWLIVMFGISGLAITLLAWLWPALESDRVMATLAGSIGIGIAVTYAFMLRKSPGDRNEKQVPVEVENKS